MLLSIALMLLLGMMMGWICKKAHLPGLIGMLMTGIVLGPYALDLIDASILEISAELRKIALIIILTRAGLSLDLEDLKRVGRPAILMCFVPACSGYLKGYDFFVRLFSAGDTGRSGWGSNPICIFACGDDNGNCIAEKAGSGCRTFICKI